MKKLQNLVRSVAFLSPFVCNLSLAAVKSSARCDALVGALESEDLLTKESLAQLLIDAESAVLPGVGDRLMADYEVKVQEFLAIEAQAKGAESTSQGIHDLKKEIAAVARSIQEKANAHNSDRERKEKSLREAEKELTAPQKLSALLSRNVVGITPHPHNENAFLVASGISVELFSRDPQTALFEGNLIRGSKDPSGGTVLNSVTFDPLNQRLLTASQGYLGAFTFTDSGSVTGSQIKIDHNTKYSHLFYNSKLNHLIGVHKSGALAIARSSPPYNLLHFIIPSSNFFKGEIVFAAFDDSHQNLFVLASESKDNLIKIRIRANGSPDVQNLSFVSFGPKTNPPVTSLTVDSQGEQLFFGDQAGRILRAPSTSQFSADAEPLDLASNFTLGPITGIAFDPETKHLFVGGDQAKLGLLQFSEDGHDLLSSSVLRLDDYWAKTPITAIYYNPRTKLLVLGGQQGKLEAFGRYAWNELKGTQ